MEDVSFEEEAALTRYKASPARTPGLVEFLISRGLVENEKQATVWLMVIAAIALVVALVIFLYFTGDRGTLSPEERAQLEQTTQIPQRR